MNKKGISTVVTTLLILLLSIVVLGVLWVVVKGLIDQSAEQIDLGKATLDLEIQTVRIQDTEVTVVVVRRNPGKGEFIGMNFVFSDGENSEVIRENTSLEETEQREFIFTLTKFITTELETVSVIPIYMTSSGKESQGNLADEYEISDEAKEGVTVAVVSNFEKNGFKGEGTLTYTVSTESTDLPEFKSATVDPLDVSLGENQTFTVVVNSPNGISNVTSVTQLDNEILNLNFEKISGGDTEDQTWSATWTVYDTHEETYITLITAVDGLGNENSMNLTWTDPVSNCVGITQGSDSTLSQDCTLATNQIAGLDGGILTIGTSNILVLNSGSKFAFNPGESVMIGGGTILFSGGSITKGYLYSFDGDGDGYAKNETLLFGVSATAPSGKNRSMNIGSGNDLCDIDAGAHPGIATYKSTQTACGDYDWNTDGVDTKRWTTGPRDVQWCNLFSTCPTEGDTIGTGYDLSPPACGSSATWITNIGDCEFEDFSECHKTTSNTATESRLQICR